MHVLLDCDPGHDDMLAILLAAQHLDVVAITTVGGNQSLDKVTTNALRVLELAGLTHIPVSRGAARPLVAEPAHAAEIHGESGLDGAELPEPTAAPASASAVETILAASRRYDDLVIVPTGPLTNIATALRVDEGLTDRIRLLSLMGGAIAGGNATPAAEFNIRVDPEAADIVFRSGVPIRMFGLDVTNRALATEARIDRIRALGGRVPTTVADLLDFFRRTSAAAFGQEGGALHDPLAVASLIRPDLFTMRPMHVEIELHGTLTRGMTVGDTRHESGGAAAGADGIQVGGAPNVDVALDVDVQGFFDLLTETLARYR